MCAKKRNNIPTHTIIVPTNKPYHYINGFRESTCKMLALPILEALHKRSISKRYLCDLINSGGLKYGYKSLCGALQGKNVMVKDFDYFSHIYYVLNLPLPTFESLLSLYLSTGGSIKLLNNPKYKVVKPKIKK